MIGVVLCGGQSSRMGEDKAMMNTKGISWAQASINVLSTLNCPIYLSVNKVQLPAHGVAYGTEILITDIDSLELYGPLSGLMSAHVKFPLQDIFILACDMQSMKSGAIIELYNIYTSQKNYEAYVFIQKGKREPLCAIYTHKALQKILKMNTDKILKKHSMNYMLDQLTVFEININPDQIEFFKNYNAPGDLQ